MASIQVVYLSLALVCGYGSATTPPKSYYISQRPAGAPPVPPRPVWTAYGDIPPLNLAEFPGLASGEASKNRPSSYNTYSASLPGNSENENSNDDRNNKDESDVDADIADAEVDSLANFESERTRDNTEGGRDDPFRDVPDADDPTFVTVTGAADDPEAGEAEDGEGEREANDGSVDDEPLEGSASNTHHQYRRFRAPATLFRAQVRDSHHVPTYVKPPVISQRFGYANGNEHSSDQEVILGAPDHDHEVHEGGDIDDGYSQHQPAYASHNAGSYQSQHQGNVVDDYHHKKAQPYHYQYYVKDDYTHNDFGQNERSDGKTVQGSYRVKLPDGRTQIVTYTADHYRGFQANVKYEGTAHHPPPSYYKDSSY